MFTVPGENEERLIDVFRRSGASGSDDKRGEQRDEKSSGAWGDPVPARSPATAAEVLPSRGQRLTPNLALPDPCPFSTLSTMRTRGLGSSDLEVTVVGLGCNNFGGRIDEEASRAVIDAALDAGVTFFDTADVYGNRGGSEEIIGRALDGAARPGRARDEVRPRPRRRRDRARRAPVHPQGDRGVAAAAADRLDRPLPVPPPRRRHADRGDARRARRARAGGKGARDRLLELHRGDGRGGARGRRRARADAVRLGAERVLVARAGRPRTSCCRPASGSGSASSRTSRSRAACSRASTGAASRRRRGRGCTAASSTTSGWTAVERLEAFAGERGVRLLDVAIGGLLAQPAVVSVIAGATKPEQVRANAAAGEWEPSPDELAALRAL